MTNEGVNCNELHFIPVKQELFLLFSHIVDNSVCAQRSDYTSDSQMLKMSTEI